MWATRRLTRSSRPHRPPRRRHTATSSRRGNPPRPSRRRSPPHGRIHGRWGWFPSRPRSRRWSRCNSIRPSRRCSPLHRRRPSSRGRCPRRRCRSNPSLGSGTDRAVCRWTSTPLDTSCTSGRHSWRGCSTRHSIVPRRSSPPPTHRDYFRRSAGRSFEAWLRRPLRRGRHYTRARPPFPALPRHKLTLTYA